MFNEKGIRTAYIGSDHGDENVDEEVLQGVYQVVLFGHVRHRDIVIFRVNFI